MSVRNLALLRGSNASVVMKVSNAGFPYIYDLPCRKDADEWHLVGHFARDCPNSGPSDMTCRNCG